ncbi:mce related protein [Mycobacteroides abscessus subsp. abscessus]|nr:mce related protein [Mycobacteroides abscessus subsp. abscessus]
MTNRMRIKARRALIALAAVTAVGTTSGCGLTVEDLPLPKPGYTLHAVFENALNLPDQAKVKIGGSTRTSSCRGAAPPSYGRRPRWAMCSSRCPSPRPSRVRPCCRTATR